MRHRRSRSQGMDDTAGMDMEGSAATAAHGQAAPWAHFLVARRRSDDIDEIVALVSTCHARRIECLPQRAPGGR